MNSFKKISLTALLALVFVTATFSVVHTAMAYDWSDSGSDCGSCGGGSTNGGNGDNEPEPPKTPTCDLSLSVSEVDNIGDSYRLEWAGTPASASFYINGTEVDATGHANFTFTGPNYDRFKMVGNNGGKTCEDEVRVTRTVVEEPTCDMFTASPATLPVGGGTVTLEWASANGTNADINGQSVAGSGTWDVNVTEDTVFTLNLSNTEGSDSCQAPVTVSEPEDSLTCNDLVFTASDTSVTPGSDVTLSWVWTGKVTSGTVNQGIGAVNSGDTRTVTVNNKTTYVTTISDGSTSKNCPLTINVATVPNQITCESNVSFAASTYSLPRGGGNVTLNWNTTGLDGVSINGVSSHAFSDSEVVHVNSGTTYTLTGTKGSQTISCPLKINVATGGGGGGGSSNLRCINFEASDTRIKAGERVTLEWKTRRARELTLFAGDKDGDELFSTDDSDEVKEGEFVVRPTKDTTYTLLLERGSRDRTCDVDIKVDDNVVVLTDRKQEPRVAGISLTQVPYTGFEAGPVLTILFYLLLALWGLFVAYTFAIKRDSLLGFSLAGAFPRKQSVTDVSTKATDSEEVVSQAAAYVATATTATAPTNLPTGNAPTIGYAQVTDTTTEAVVADETEEDTLLSDIENRAHAQHALLSSDALRYFTGSYATEEQFEALDGIIKNAKTNYPSEDGWVVINLERIQELMDTTEVAVGLPTTPVTAGSLAEAIVAGNTTAALIMVGSRPMVALADATTDLDALYRMRNGGDETVSDLLASAAAAVSDEKVKEAIHALNSAVDGTYSSETDAVKTAILKAINVLS